MRWPAILLCAALTACEGMYEPQMTMGERCASYGFRYGTDAYGNCMLRLQEADIQRRTALGAIRIPRLEMPQSSRPVLRGGTVTNCQWVGSQMWCYSQ